MILGLLAVGFYLAMGAALAVMVDGDNMKKPVPYGDTPSMIPLRYIRCWVYVAVTFFWVPMFIKPTVRVIRKHFFSGEKQQS